MVGDIVEADLNSMAEDIVEEEDLIHVVEDIVEEDVIQVAEDLMEEEDMI